MPARPSPLSTPWDESVWQPFDGPAEGARIAGHLGEDETSLEQRDLFLGDGTRFGPWHAPVHGERCECVDPHVHARLDIVADALVGDRERHEQARAVPSSVVVVDRFRDPSGTLVRVTGLVRRGQDGPEPVSDPVDADSTAYVVASEKFSNDRPDCSSTHVGQSGYLRLLSGPLLGFLTAHTNRRLGRRLWRSATDALVECGTDREGGVCQTLAAVASGEVEDHRCLTERDAIDVHEGQQAPVDRIELAEGWYRPR
jgi:hypothetical protein